MNCDEKRALKILHDKYPEDKTLTGRFIDFIRQRNVLMIGRKYKGTAKFCKPEQIAEDFEVWQEQLKNLMRNPT